MEYAAVFLKRRMAAFLLSYGFFAKLTDLLYFLTAKLYYNLCNNAIMMMNNENPP